MLATYHLPIQPNKTLLPIHANKLNHLRFIVKKELKALARHADKIKKLNVMIKQKFKKN